MSIQPLNVAFQKRVMIKHRLQKPKAKEYTENILNSNLETQTETDACPVVQLGHGKKQVDEEKDMKKHIVYTMNTNNRQPQSTVKAK